MQTVTVHLSVAGLTLLQQMVFRLQALKLHHPLVRLALALYRPLPLVQLAPALRHPLLVRLVLPLHRPLFLDQLVLELQVLDLLQLVGAL